MCCSSTSFMFHWVKAMGSQSTAKDRYRSTCHSDAEVHTNCQTKGEVSSMTFSETIARLFRRENTDKYMSCYTLANTTLSSGIELPDSASFKFGGAKKIIELNGKVMSVSNPDRGIYLRYVNDIDTRKYGRILNLGRDWLLQSLSWHTATCPAGTSFSNCPPCTLLLDAVNNSVTKEGSFVTTLYKDTKHKDKESHIHMDDRVLFIRDGGEVIFLGTDDANPQSMTCVRAVAIDGQTSLEVTTVPCAFT
jgi:hypothetical protein